MSMNSIPRHLSCLVLLFAAACGQDGTKAEAAALPRVAATFHPTAFFVAYVAGEYVEVVRPLPADADPAFWEPSPEALLEIQGADLIVLNGAGFERWAESVSLPDSRVLRTAEGFRQDWIERDSGSHSHGGLAPHSHGGVDGHTWMDPLQAVLQAEAIRDALKERWPERAAAFDEGFARLRSELEALDGRWRKLAPGLEGLRLVASHPSYDYLARRYGFELTNLDLAPEETLPEPILAELAELAAGNARTLVLWEADPLAETRAALAANGIESVLYAPAEVLAPSEHELGRDFLDVMNENIDRLEALLGD